MSAITTLISAEQVERARLAPAVIDVVAVMAGILAAAEPSCRCRPRCLTGTGRKHDDDIVAVAAKHRVVAGPAGHLVVAGAALEWLS